MRVLFLESHPMWIHGLPNGFRDAGHQVMVSGSLTENRLEGIIKQFQPELMVSMGWGPENSDLGKQAWIAKQISLAKIPHVYWATEDPTHTLTFTLPFLRRVQPDFVFTICRNNTEFYQEFGIKAAHLDFGYHPAVHHPVPQCREHSFNIAVVANAYPRKLADYPNHFRHESLRLLVRPLLNSNIRVDFYGHSWDEMAAILGQPLPPEWLHGPIEYTEANKIYRSSKIILGLQNHPDQLTQRIYEIMGSGGFLLTNDTPEINRLFKVGQDLAATDSPETTVRLVDYYLTHPEEREAIQAQGEIAVSRHSYKDRAEYMVEVLESQGILAGKKSDYQLAAIDKLLTPTMENGDYRVVNGDTLWNLSRRFKIPLERLKELNGLNAGTIYAGQILHLENKGDAWPGLPVLNCRETTNRPGWQVEDASSDEHLFLYNVRRGDTLGGLAEKFGTPVDEIKTLNDLVADLIFVGQLLRVRNNKKIPPPPLSILISRGLSPCKHLSLTYDAGSEAAGASSLLDILRKHSIKATFFLTGMWAEKFPCLAKRITADGHEIGNHSYSHPDFTKLTPAAMAKELKGAEEAISKITGKDCRPLFRPPFGAWNEEVLKAAGDAGYSRSIYWSLDTVDWQQPAPETIAKRILEKAESNDIVLMHLNHLDSALASDMVIPKLKKAGFELVEIGRQLLF